MYINIHFFTLTEKEMTQQMEFLFTTDESGHSIEDQR